MVEHNKTPLKPVAWIASSKRDLKQFPADVQHVFGFAILEAQRGKKHPSAKPLRGYGGASVLEVVEDHGGSTYRAVYTVKFQRVLHVPHAFQKKSVKGVKTPKHEIDLIDARQKMAASHYTQWSDANPEVKNGEEKA